ncbi:MAG: tetratricopeptide repeat protein [Deltaproteobacteria bacterium]|nr:tetratricopeptide repeat protein [Deltaproteobacteria bacterium]
MHTSRILSKPIGALAAFGTALLMTLPVSAAPTKPQAPAVSENPQATKLYEAGKKEVDKDLFPAALKRFEAADSLDPDNPDILNMLAYSQRKTGDLDSAIKNYHRALELRSDFPEAREYLGEAYIQAALREIATLAGYGKDGEHEHEELVEALKEAADQF